MARYIDAVSAAEIISEKLNIPLGDLVDVFAEIPTAEVVPRREIALEIIDKIQRPLTMYKRPIFSYDLILQEMIKAIGAVIEEYTEGKV